jgi:cytidine deaminase
MIKNNLSSEFFEYNNAEELGNEERELINAATTALHSAYAPYSGFLVGSAVLLANGKTITGGNQENASFPVSICGERVALFAAATQYPDVEIKAIAIVTKSIKEKNGPAAPCGMCRQAIAEYEFKLGNPIKLILKGDTDTIYIVPKAGELLPLGFNADFLK